MALTIESDMAAAPPRSRGAATFGRFGRLDVAILIGFMLAYGVVSVHGGKNIDWDLFNYHFYNGWAAWTGRGSNNIAPAHLQSFINPALDIPGYLAIANLPPLWVGFLIGAFQGTGVYILFAIIRRLGRLGRGLPDVLIALVAAEGALSGPAAISEIGSAVGDLTLAVPVLLGVLFVVRAFGSDASPHAARWIIAAGVAFGATAGIKYTEAIYALAAAAALLVCPPPALSRGGTLLRLAVSGTASFLAAAGPWMIVLDRRWGSPMFPFFNAIFHSPYMAPVNWFDPEFQFKSLLGALGFPFSLLHEGKHHLQIAFRTFGLLLAFSCLFLSAALAIVACAPARQAGRAAAWWRRLRLLPVERWLLLYFFLCYGIWAVTFGDYRYLVASEVLIPAVIALTVCQLLPWPATRLAILLAVAIGTASFGSVGSFGRMWWDGGTYFEVTLPPDAARPGTMVLMTGVQATSFVIPFFPHGVRFVRVQLALDHLESRRFEAMIARAIAAQKGPLALLTTTDALAGSDAVIRRYGLAIVAGSCRNVQSIFRPEIELCRLARN